MEYYTNTKQCSATKQNYTQTNNKQFTSTRKHTTHNINRIVSRHININKLHATHLQFTTLQVQVQRLSNTAKATAQRCDKINIRYLKYLSDSSISHNYTHLLILHIILHIWMLANIISIPKTITNNNLCISYRLISQHGYKCNHSTDKQHQCNRLQPKAMPGRIFLQVNIQVSQQQTPLYFTGEEEQNTITAAFSALR